MLNNKNFMEFDTSYEEANIVLASIPYDGTTSYRPGTRFAGDYIRFNSLIGYETYSVQLDDDLENYKIADIGSLEVPLTDPEIVQSKIKKKYQKIINDNKKIATIGGEHSISYGIISALKEKYGENLYIIQLDAHTDLREEYLGSKYSHACVMKRICEIIPPENIYQFGIRSGLKEEFEYAQKNTNLYKYSLEGLKEIIEKLKDKKVYITIDLDVLDPAFFPGTGTPEPDGITTRELFENVYNFTKLNNLIGFDIVELSPLLDESQMSTAVAIKLLREMLIILSK